ncbi:MAG TPA: hypothetical protein VFL93_03475 [Longimicrobiaceae bacterium]|nr:hypothetical protein [Longimicrobiaceae bacterium]
MKTRLLKLVLLPLLTLAAVQGCERSATPLIPVDPVFAVAPQHGLHKVRDRGRAHSSTDAAAVIGPEGGVVELGSHRLIVPEGAVAHPTRFSMHLVDGGFVEVDLNAASSSHGPKNDAGKRGFSRPVTLELGYDDAAAADTTGDLVIAWVQPDGTLQPLRSTRDESQHVISAELQHFSPYALASD